ncbi:MAG: hypothetical protein HY906_18310 [Deltaproteobacteria bacterium]|nr:hypothetical protein [Deltaproteobacteria bacterium]
MKDEYDFSHGKRGQFYRPDARMSLPVYLDEEVLAYLKQRAEAKGVSLGELVNDLLKHDIGLLEAVK